MNILVTTGCGYPTQGGADIWVNHFLKEVYEGISKDTANVVLVDGRKPIGWSDRGVEGIPIHFYRDDVELSLNLLKSCEKIHFLHSNYHRREHLMEHKDKFGICFVHAYPYDILNCGNTSRRMLLNTGVVPSEYEEMLEHCEKIVWIGINKNSQLFEDFDNIIHIPNFYEFRQNKEYVQRVNPTIGYTARIETRKNPQFIDGLKGFVLTSKRDWQNLKDIESMDDSKLKLYQWDTDILEPFMNKTWSISHSCHEKEPFGYSIFQAVDWGKIPIIHTDWEPDLDYKYRASSKVGFLTCFTQIMWDSKDEVETEFMKLKEFMEQFDNKETWKKRVTNLFLC